MQTGLAGKTAVITGSTRGIGRGIAAAMAEAGARVVVISRSAEDCRRVAGELAADGRDALGIAADVTRRQDIDSLID
ncbi:MAG: SDR family NAD(P)-dependent oxidoreductase, partial [Negativicutes bacterium]|nr:SDR family NAD(P)-dependent oxidoreductase [Negativicutes bacterium]